MNNPANVLWFHQIDLDDVNLVGGKGGNLGEMYQLGIPVPNGFVVTSTAYFKFIEENNLKPQIKDILKITDVDQPDQLLSASKKIRNLIRKSPISQNLSLEIIKSYKKLSGFGGLKNVPVAVRTSATAEDSADASFAGQGDTFLNVIGEANVIDRVRDCWSSLFTSRSIFYQVKKHYDHFKIGVAVPVQKLIDSEISGIMFTANPVTGDKKQIIVETIWGLGEYIVQGKITPDQYVINKDNWEIISENHTSQDVQLVRDHDETGETRVPKSKQNRNKIDTNIAIKIAKIGQKLTITMADPKISNLPSTLVRFLLFKHDPSLLSNPPKIKMPIKIKPLIKLLI